MAALVALSGKDQGWSTVRQVQAYIGNRIQSLPANPATGAQLTKDFAAFWVHTGKRSVWNYIAVEGPMSDLVGCGRVEMWKPPNGGPEFMYRPRRETA